MIDGDMIYYCDRNNLYACHHQPQLKQQQHNYFRKTILANWYRNPAKINLIFLGILCIWRFSKRKNKWWRFINLKICQNLWLFLKKRYSLSVCVFFGPFSICYSCPPQPSLYTSNDNFVATSSSPLLSSTSWTVSSKYWDDEAMRWECPVYNVVAGPGDYLI